MNEQMNSANRLIHETSPYLRQHAFNPVDWFPWGEEALQKAREEDKPIFLSIGYSACHWCHVMEKESFMDERVAQYLKQHFVSIKVDREERPDLDSIYMNAVVLMTGQGGWPTSLFLTPSLEPFFGGTYFPPVPRQGMIAFIDVLKAIHQAWQQDREHVFSTAKQITQRLQSETRSAKNSNQEPRTDLVEMIRDELISAYDWQNGGWGRAPKFPQPLLLEFFCLQASRGHDPSRKLVLHALEAMSRGGMYDLIGSGFHRYSTDVHWLAPHFEKMLYDNAQLALVYLHAYLLNLNPNFKKICTDTLDFILTEMTDPLGGFYSSLDADSQGEEGKFYLWTEPELQTHLTADKLVLLNTVYPHPPEGNFEGHVIFQRIHNPEQIAQQLNLTVDDLTNRLVGILAELRRARNARPRPATDKKVITSWNGLTLRAFAEAGRYLDRSDYLKVAQRNANFILTSLWTSDGLQRLWNDGQSKVPAFLEDYGSLILGLIALYQTDFNLRWFSSACLLRDEMILRFADPNGGFFDTQDHANEILLRPKDVQDSATPSGNALAASSLLILDAFSGETNNTLEVARLIGGFQSILVQYPTSFGYWLQILDFMKGPVQQIALVSPKPQLEPNGLGDYLARKYLPRSVLAASGLPVSDNAPELLHNRPAINNLPTVYVCEDFLCRLPVTDLQELIAQLT